MDRGNLKAKGLYLKNLILFSYPFLRRRLFNKEKKKFCVPAFGAVGVGLFF
jgi:hypothetical protein